MRQRRKAASPNSGCKSRVNVGRTFADKDRPDRWYVCLQIDGGPFALVWWERGRVRSVAREKVKIEAYDFPVYLLLAQWGITSKQLDAFMERRVYRFDPEVRTVRAKRRPLTGRTIEHVRPRHPDPTRVVRGT